jgi:DNA-binding CsgD family transcriptional regulator
MWDFNSFPCVRVVVRRTITPVAIPSHEQARERFVRLLHRGLELMPFFDAADGALSRVVPFDASCWLTLDPGTLLPTSHFTRQIGSDHLMAMAANEYLEEDVNKFADLARSTPPVGILSTASGGDLRRSPRHRNVLAPHGYADGDELRAVFVDGESAWGCVALHRRRGRFEGPEAAAVAELGGLIAEGIRRAVLATALAADGETDVPGLILLRGDDSVESVTPAATRWVGEILDPTGGTGGLPMIVVGIAARARRAATGRSEEVARARLPMKTRGWLQLDASLLDGDLPGRVGVMVQPAKSPEIAALIVEAYGLSEREREVTHLVLRGLSTLEIAQDLHLSPYTVQDHLKAIFAKVGVRSRRELVAQMFLQHYAPRLETGAKIGADGWFAHEGSQPGFTKEGVR